MDEHIWCHTGLPGTEMVTRIVDHTRDADGTVHARLLDLVEGRSGKAYADWLKDPGETFTAGIKTTPHWIRSAATPTRCVKNCPRPSPFWMHFTS